MMHATSEVGSQHHNAQKNLNAEANAEGNVREQALDLRHSYIVQAPAGSGKTTLLTLRFLNALSHAQDPEEILAITFTRKAAHEMRHRVLDYLNNAETMMQQHPHLKEILHQILIKNNQLKWDLLKHPNRLQIKTIDALCLNIIQQMPLQARLGFQIKISEHPQALYHLAAQRLLNDHAILDEPNQKALNTLLFHMDHQMERVVRLFSESLARRDQWMEVVLASHQQENLQTLLENSLKQLHQQILTHLWQQRPTEFDQEFHELMQFSLQNLERPPLISQTWLKEPNIEDIHLWQHLKNVLLIQTGHWRKSLDKRQGFPAASSALDKETKQLIEEMKQRALTLIKELQRYEHWRILLAELAFLPPQQYSKESWEILSALIQILPLLVAQLHVIFREQNTVDFIEIAQRALFALGHEEEPTDLALSWERKLNHILIDEFQDTSVTQYQLIQKLIHLWQPDDGKTLFLVGDPMQSIYRFRKAEISLFLQIQQQGFGHLPLKNVQLLYNFRSQPSLIQWMNHQFSNLFPKEIDLTLGGVPFVKAIAKKENNPQEKINWHIDYTTEDHQYEERIAHCVAKIKHEHPEDRIAILVRARHHLGQLLPRLKQKGIPYHALEMQPLYPISVVQDLLALTRILLMPHDRIAWLACLRAPWCGLTLNALTLITQHIPDGSFWPKLKNFPIEHLEQEEQIYLKSFMEKINLIFDLEGKKSLNSLIRYAFELLDGPRYYGKTQEILAIESFFKSLRSFSHRSLHLNPYFLETFLKQQTIDETTDDPNPIQVMTIHKAKGLEFDHVILLGLEQATTSDSEQLLLIWDQMFQEERHSLIAPLSSRLQAEADPYYTYLKRQEQKRTYYEIDRVLYVACTRAKTQLHLCARLEKNEDGAVKMPRENSFLHRLWTAAQDVLDMPLSETSVENTLNPKPAKKFRRRKSIQN